MNDQHPPLQATPSHLHSRSTSSRAVGALLALALLASAALVGSGCASMGGAQGDYDIDQGELATRALPGTREVPHPPDSLAHLQITEKEGKLDFQVAKAYIELLSEWTAGQQGQARSDFRTHATLWSKELSLISLIPERGVQTLSKDLARELVRERTAEYDSLVQIDVYIFAPSRRRLDLGDLQLDTAGQRVYLRDENDDTYRPVRIETSAPLEAYYAGRRSLYGRNAVFFDRYTEDGRDLLDAQELRLYVRPYGYHFTWFFPESKGAMAATEDQ